MSGVTPASPARILCSVCRDTYNFCAASFMVPLAVEMRE